MPSTMNRRHARDDDAADNANGGGGEVSGRPTKKMRFVTPTKNPSPSPSSLGALPGISPSGNSVVSPPSAIHVDQLLEQTTEQGIKDLLRWSILTGRVDLQRLAAAPKKPIRIDNVTVRSDGWNGLDSNVLAKVFSLLNVKEKVVCVSRICKAWNKLKARSELFRNLTDESVPNVDHMSSLIGWLPLSSRSAVTGLRIVTSESDKISPVSLLARMHAAKTRVNPTLRTSTIVGDGAQQPKKKDIGLVDLETIFLCGPGIDGLSVHFPLGYGTGPNLKCLTLDGLSRVKSRYMRIDPSKAKNSPLYYLTQLLGKCPGLEILRMPPSLVSPLGLIHSLGAIGAPDVVTTSLKTLDLTMSMRDSDGVSENAKTIKWSDVRQLGRYCPQLEILKLRCINVVGDEISAYHPEDDSKQVTILPRLRVCVIERQEDMAYNLGFAQFIVVRLLRGTPSIEEFSIGSGALSNDEPKPYTQNAFQTPMPSLRKLRLEGFSLSNASFSGIDPGQIESITLKKCCNHARSALEAFQTSSNVANASVIGDGDAVCLVVKKG